VSPLVVERAMDKAHTIYRPRLDTTSREACDVRARAWAYIFRCYAKHEAASEHNNADIARADHSHTRKGG
jgi:hypothetical protein